MSEDCTHDCATCGKSCGERKEAFDFSAKLNAASRVGRVIAVASGKGGVGKSFVTTMPTYKSDDGMEPTLSNGGIRVMSLNMLVEDPSDPVVWRGPVIAGVVKQFWTDVHWGELDVMFVDMPPGTGDVPLTVFQSLPVDGVVLVTSPQDLVEMIVSKSAKMAAIMKKPILGLVENMSYLKCPDCGRIIEVFGKSTAEDLARRFSIPETVRLPIDPAFSAAIDAGAAETIDLPEFESFASKMLADG